MSQLHFYADAHSASVLAASGAKAVLVGSDFGYGNFGDVLQHVGSVDRIKAWSSLSVVSVLSLDAISRHIDVSWMRSSYGVDAQMFVTTEPLTTDQAERLGLSHVLSLRNVSCVQLYGGGFLNEMWGGFVLEVAEFLLTRLPGAAYVVSGQQISESYSAKVKAHFDQFKPRLIGVRDRDSLANLQALGVDAAFSFDDAVEPLQALSKVLVPTRSTTGAILHLNTSGYTGNGAELEELSAHMHLISQRSGARDVVLLQAFQDSREEVIDSLETVKRLEASLPFVDLSTIMLVSFIMNPNAEQTVPIQISGEYGYACSYHVTMWLQLNGIPCWLRGSNNYYDQKRRSLGVEGDFEHFLEHLPIVDHSENLEARSAWSQRLEAVISGLPAAQNSIEWQALEADSVRRSFNFKGEPRMEERLKDSWGAVVGLHEDIARVNSELTQSQATLADTQGSLESTQTRLQETNDLLGDTASALEKAKAERGAAEAELSAAEAKLQARLQAYGEQITVIGADARHYREQADREHFEMLRAAEAERNAAAALQQVLDSRSWKWTMPIRMANRFISTRRFDAQGNVGLFELVRRALGRLPIGQVWRIRLERQLGHLRRR